MTKSYKRSDETRYGFGLNIVERIVQAHNTNLAIQNRMDGEIGLMIIIKFNS